MNTKKIIALLLVICFVLPMVASCGEIPLLGDEFESNTTQESKNPESTEEESKFDEDSKTDETSLKENESNNEEGSKQETNSQNEDATDSETSVKECDHSVIKIESKVDPTCISKGKTEGKTCFLCGEILVHQEEIATVEHQYVDGTCTMCKTKEAVSNLEISSVSVDKSMVMAKQTVTFSVDVGNSDSEFDLIITIYLDGNKVAELAEEDALTYTPTVAGRYDAKITITDAAYNAQTYFLKSCFEVKSFWDLKQFSADKNKVNLGDSITFSADIDGERTDLNYTINVYKDNELCYSVFDVDTLEFMPNDIGTYYAEIIVIDSYGEAKAKQSGEIQVEIINKNNEVLSSNTGDTLNVDDLYDNKYFAIVPDEGVTLTWNKESSDSYYKLKVKSLTDDNVTAIVDENNYTLNSYTINSEDLIRGAEYRVYFYRYNSAGSRIEYIQVNFTVEGGESILLEKSPEFISPKHNGIYSHNDLVLQWHKMNYATHYKLTLEYYCGSEYHIVFDDIVLDGDVCSYLVSKTDLQIGAKHRISLCAYDALGNETDVVNYFRIEGDTKEYVLTTPDITNEYFYDGWSVDMKSYPVYEDIELTWTKVPAAAYYIVSIVSENEKVEDPVIANADHVEDNSFVIPMNKLVAGCKYSIQVSACCKDGHKRTSEEKNFRAPYSNGTVLDPPVVISYELSTDKNDPTPIVEQELTFTWKNVTAASRYSVYWYEVGLEDSEYKSNNITTNSVTIPKDAIFALGSNGYTDFCLEIVAIDSNDMSVSTYYYVRIIESAIESPILKSPALATNDDGELPSFEDSLTIVWGAVEGAVSYRVRVYELYNDDYDEILTVDGIATTSFEIPIDELYMGGKYRVNIRAYDQYGNGKYSKYYFQVGSSDYIGLSKNDWNPEYEADYKYIYVETVGDWTAKTSASWITLSDTSGTGTTRLKINVAENTGDFARSGNIKFTNSEGGTAVFSITQSADGSTNTGVVQITAPKQGDIIEKDLVTAKWTCKYGWHYFNLTLTNLTDNEIVYTEEKITIYYAQIPEKYFEQGHTYQLTIAQYYNDQKSSESSIVFKIEGDIVHSTLPDDDGGDSGNDNNQGSGGNSEENNKPIVVPTICDHSVYSMEMVGVYYQNLIKNSNEHSGYYLYNRTCTKCKQSLESEKVSFSKSKHTVNSKGFCDCGYINTANYTKWNGKNNSGKRVTVYQTPVSTAQYGYIHDNESIVVLGEYGGRYLIEYSLDNGGGKKQGYVYKNELLDEEATYSIFIDSEYFVNSDINRLVVSVGSYYQIFIKNNKTGEIIKYGTNGFKCVSENDKVAMVGGSGTLSVHSEGTVLINLFKEDEFVESMIVIGCYDRSIITNYSTIRNSDLYKNGFAINSRLNVFNYKSRYVADNSYEGGGYYKVTFDVYNDVPTIFCVAAFDKDGNMACDKATGKYQQQLIEGYSDDMIEQTVSAFVHFKDLFNGKMIGGESEAYQTKTSVTLKVPLGGYVDFLTLANSDYMIYANVLSGIVVGAMETADAWTDFVKVASDDIEFDKIKFAQELVELISEETHMSADNIVTQIIGIILDAEDYAALATELMAYLGDNGVSMTALFKILADCSTSALNNLRDSIAKGTIDIALGAVPPAKFIKKLSDAFVASLQYAIVIKDIASMVNRTQDFLIVVYPNEPID